MPLVTGQKLTHYQIIAPLGAGGMGEVYRARDTHLDREVAIKVLRDAFVDDEERLRRFEREAKALATLLHPHIGSIFGFDNVDGVCFLALELIEGEDLADALERGALPLEEALDVCRQIAEGLEAAHEAGVVHRDLKPANVRVTPDGQVKLLDFGLAKPMRERSAESSTESNSGPRPDSFLMTEEGRVLGTPTYMSPEQARAKPVDRRTDVWAFGCVLFECLTGKRAFGGENIADVMSAIVSEDVDLDELPDETPPRVRELITRCLVKDPRQRLRDVGEARLVLEEPWSGAAGPLDLSAPPRRGHTWIVAAVFLVLIAALFQQIASRSPAASEKIVRARLAIRLPPGTQLPISVAQSEHQFLSISRDASQVAFLLLRGSTTYLAVRRLDSLEIRELAGTEGATDPFFSPDGLWVGFFADGRLKKVSVAGGNPIELCDVAGITRGGAWGPNDAIVFAASSSSPLSVISAHGGPVRQITTLDQEFRERTHRWPAFLPGGEEVLFTVGTLFSPGDYENATIDAVSLETGKRRRLIEGASMARTLPSGELLYSRGGEIFAMDLAEANGGSPVDPVLVLRDVAGLRPSGVVFFDAADDATLLYAERDPAGTDYQMAWLDRDGAVAPLLLPLREYEAPRLSPDGKRVAVSIGPGIGENSDVWIGEVETGRLTRITFDEHSGSPIWSPDGQRVTFSSHNDEGEFIGWKSADGSDSTTPLIKFDDALRRGPLDWTHDGKWLLFQGEGTSGTSNDIFAYSMETEETVVIAAKDVTEWNGSLSPDGRYLVYNSEESGTAELYVRSFPTGAGRWQISDLGAECLWSPKGDEILYMRNGMIMSVPVTTDPGFSHGPPREIVRVKFRSFVDVRTNFDVAEDGRLLILRSPSEDTMEQHMNVVFGALEDLR